MASFLPTSSCVDAGNAAAWRCSRASDGMKRRSGAPCSTLAPAPASRLTCRSPRRSQAPEGITQSPAGRGVLYGTWHVSGAAVDAPLFSFSSCFSLSKPGLLELGQQNVRRPGRGRRQGAGRRAAPSVPSCPEAASDPAHLPPVSTGPTYQMRFQRHGHRA